MSQVKHPVALTNLSNIAVYNNSWYAISSSVLYRSDNQGATWSSVYTFSTSVYAVYVTPEGYFIVIGSPGKAWYLSTDMAKTFTNIGNIGTSNYGSNDETEIPLYKDGAIYTSVVTSNNVYTKVYRYDISAKTLSTIKSRSGSSYDASGVIYYDEKYMFAGVTGNELWTSATGLADSWTSTSLEMSGSSYKLFIGGDGKLYCVAGNPSAGTYSMKYSTNGSTWSSVINIAAMFNYINPIENGYIACTGHTLYCLDKNYKALSNIDIGGYTNYCWRAMPPYKLSDYEYMKAYRDSEGSGYAVSSGRVDSFVLPSISDYSDVPNWYIKAK